MTQIIIYYLFSLIVLWGYVHSMCKNSPMFTSWLKDYMIFKFLLACILSISICWIWLPIEIGYTLRKLNWK